MHRNKLIIYILGGIFILSLLFGLIAWIYTSIESESEKSLNDKITRKKQELKRESAKAASLSEWTNIEEHFKKFKSEYLMNMNEFTKFREDFSVIISKNQLMTKKNPNYKFFRIFKDFIRVEAVFKVYGSYVNIKRFLHEIINHKKMLLIKSIKFTKELSAGGMIGARFSMEVFLAN